jgi:hypothetical protein
VAFLFGRGADGATCACDANGDGLTNPTAINGNNLASLSADDDGGFFKQKVAAYYAQGTMSLSGGTTQPTASSTATPTRTSTPVGTTSTPTSTTAPPSATPTRTPTISPTQPPVATTWTATGSTSASSILLGQKITVRATVRASKSATALVDLEVYNSSGQKVYQKVWDNQDFSANVSRTFSSTWRVPSNLPRGTYTIKVGVFGPAWAGLHAWNNAAAIFVVR